MILCGDYDVVDIMFKEINGDLFACPTSYSLAHCISCDAVMSKGIAIDFVRKFPTIAQLRSSGNQIGSAIPIFVDGRFIYSLITKKRFYDKPVVSTLKHTLQSMLWHALENGVINIAMPKIASGCDKLNFELVVKPLIISVFNNTRINIFVHHLDYLQHGYALETCTYLLLYKDEQFMKIILYSSTIVLDRV